MTTELIITNQGFLTTPEKLFTPEGVKLIVDEIKLKVDEFKNSYPDVTTDKGQKEVGSFNYKIARTKTPLDDLGTKLVEEETKKVRNIQSLRKHIKDSLDGFRDELKKPVDEFKAIEEARIHTIQMRINDIKSTTSNISFIDKQAVNDRLVELENLNASGFDFQEFLVPATKAYQDSKEQLEQRLVFLAQQEEIEALRREKAARDAADELAKRTVESLDKMIQKHALQALEDTSVVTATESLLSEKPFMAMADAKLKAAEFTKGDKLAFIFVELGLFLSQPEEARNAISSTQIAQEILKMITGE